MGHDHVLAVAVALQPVRRPHMRTRVIREQASAAPRCRCDPRPDLEPIEIVEACFGGLQQPDEPLPDAGYERLFYFCTYTCRKAITARMGADSLANFTKHTELSPAVQPFTRAARIRIVDEPTIIAGTPTRGPMATVGVDVFIAPSFRHAQRLREGVGRPRGAALRDSAPARAATTKKLAHHGDFRYAVRAFAGDTGNDLQRNKVCRDACIRGLGRMETQRHRRGAFFSSTIRSEMPE